MNEDDASGLGLGYRDEIPIEWESCELPEGAVLDRYNAGVVRIVRALTSFEEIAGDPGEEINPLTHAVTRLEGKVDLLLNLVGRLVHRHVALPDRHRVRVCTDGIEWADCPDQIDAGAVGIAVVYLQPAIPISLRVPAKVRCRVSSGEEAWTHVGFAGLSNEARDLLQKYVFRHHRREIAWARENS